MRTKVPRRLLSDRKLKTVVSLFILSIFLLLGVLRVADLRDRREEILAASEERAGGMARIVVQYVHEVFAVADASLRQLVLLDRRLGGPGAPREDWQPVLRSALAGLTGVGSLSITDAEGTIRQSTLDAIVGQERRDEYVFKRLASANADVLVASTPFRSITDPKQILIPFGRRLTTPDSQFQGTVVATFLPQELLGFCRAVDIGKNGTISVFHPDGLVLIHEPAPMNPLHETAVGNPLFESARHTNKAGMLRGALQPGGPEMLSAFEPLSEPEIIVAVSLSQAEVLAEWRADVRASVFGFSVGAIAAMLLVSVLFRQIDARSVAELELQQESIRREVDAVEARRVQDLATARAAFAAELERKNTELEAFSYSVSHDLRAPLRSIDGFSRLLAELDDSSLSDRGREFLQHVRRSVKRMDGLITSLLQFSLIGRSELRRIPVDLTALASEVVLSLQKANPERQIDLVIEESLRSEADQELIRNVLENLIGNAWKFTEKKVSGRIEFGTTETVQGRAFFVRDNGAGFDMTYADKLFQPFQRLHQQAEFPGNGVGLATVQRIVERHGGRIWAEGATGQGATFFFTLPV